MRIKKEKLAISRFVFTIEMEGNNLKVNVENTGIPEPILLYHVEQWLHLTREKINRQLYPQEGSENKSDYGTG